MASPANPTGLPSVLDTAARGIERAFTQFDRAAAEVQSASTSLTETDRVSISEEARKAAEAQKGQEADLVGGMVDMQLAKHALGASVRVLEAGDEMLAELLTVGTSGRTE